MENIYQETVLAVQNGARFKVDFGRKSLKVNGKYVIKDGEYDGSLGVETDDAVSHIEELYGVYKHSIPSQRSESGSMRYFYALPETDLDDEDMLYGEKRDTARVKLELYFLASVLNGSLNWDALSADDVKTKWFWQSKKDKNLIILKKWMQ